jgi:hypothetical protein
VATRQAKPGRLRCTDHPARRDGVAAIACRGKSGPLAIGSFGVTLSDWPALVNVSGMATSDRTMFEIYREAGYGRAYRVVYFTELEEKNKEQEINRAMAGEHVFDGFLLDLKKETGKARVAEILARLNAGESMGAGEITAQLEGFLA